MHFFYKKHICPSHPDQKTGSIQIRDAPVQPQVALKGLASNRREESSWKILQSSAYFRSGHSRQLPNCRRNTEKLCQSLSRRILDNEEDAKECVNDTWLGVWNSIPPQTPNPLVSYVCRITRNLSVKRLRHNMAAKRNSYYDVSLAELEECIPAAQEQEPWEEQEVTKVLERFLRELDTGSRVMFVKRYWYAESVAQIAETFGMKENSVSVKLMRLRKKLRKKLEKEGVVL